MTTVLLERSSRAAPDGQSPLAWALMPLVPLSHLYALGMRARARLYAAGVFAQRSLPLRVISVGNLTVGGTGKTPIVIALANALREKHHRVGVVSRGYGRRSADEILEVSDGERVRGEPEKTGDEPFLIAGRCSGVPVAVGSDRHRTGSYLLERYGIDTLVLDDGFQHLALRRDVDMLVLDATAPFGNGYVLPRGRLRESLSAVSRATVLMISRAGQARNLDELRSAVRRLNPKAPMLVTDFRAEAVWELGSLRQEEPAWLRGRRVAAVSGIGNPDSFRRLLERQGAIVVEHLVFGDHHRYTRPDLDLVRSAGRRGADWIVTTEKDAVKLQSWGEATTRQDDLKGVWALRIGLEWLEGQDEWERLVTHG